MLVSVRLSDEVVARIDELAGAGQRSRWIVRAVEAALGGGGGAAGSRARPAVKSSVAPGAVVAVSGSGGFAREDDRVLWEALRSGSGSERQMRDRLGWAEMRVSRAASSLLRSGRAVVGAEGMLEAVG